jgi:aryl-alcohol dehydrogenase-like predicted oxidoreductase
MTRFQPEVYEHNMKIVEVIKKAAERHNATPAQVRAPKMRP